ncbi:MAG: methyltransferase family protein [Dongiaceae bacterium]
MIRRLILQTILWIAAMGALLFIPAGTPAWPAAWVYLAEMGATSLAVGLWLARYNPELLAERMSSLIQREQKPWDKLLMAGLIVLWCAWLVLMALDSVRYGWSQVPRGVQIVGMIGVLVGMHIAYRTLRTNSFAVPVVKIQKERGHKVVTTGPYRHVRPPRYSGALVIFLSVPLLLGSWYGLLLVPPMAVALGIRAIMEERALTGELEGYEEYAARVRYRLIPLIW